MKSFQSFKKHQDAIKDFLGIAALFFAGVLVVAVLVITLIFAAQKDMARAEVNKAQLIARAEKDRKINKCFEQKHNAVHLYFNIFQISNNEKIRVSKEDYGNCWID